MMQEPHPHNDNQDKEMEHVYKEIEIKLNSRNFNLLIQILGDPNKIIHAGLYKVRDLYSDARCLVFLRKGSRLELKKFHLRYFHMDKERICAISNIVKTTSSLCQLYLQHCNIDAIGAFMIGESVKTTSTTSVTVLNLDGKLIEDDGAIALANALETNQHLETLSLDKNMISSRGAVAIAKKCIGVNSSSLLRLDLYGNMISEKGAVAIAENLSMNCWSSKLRYLHLGKNRIGNLGMIALARALKRKNMPLETLLLHFNNVGNTGACALANSLRVNNHTLTTIDLQRNLIGNPGVLALLGAVEMNSSIDSVELFGNRCNRQLTDAVDSIVKKKERNRVR
mmetsp:Transcript_4298/g.6490  ORF Transcript_4298/g.6490 Transcript_4298/m.6490 type:complete len:339 (+) Transcript_4298:128-1144(+)|eukprot:CAMPEP_0118692740 /NCGR_PEP_ID=MMETSP0800-20121206/11480_1 /TAXON_ID=210618 ORGANISM="Striatella unipunctata, Strain CCMP2910" /NCGR_SAMPLE_ID=MMETSP0800 /ASSEMBLY_ACC=CAM_ASM_000638 /LENGTH=338 /DNA_ID=CAMNT_0006590817 /DNA_START=90 /DNA_END=1106 /DNA_ORIENTATION=+